MPISVICPCGKKLRLADDKAGKRVRCPACNDVLDVEECREDKCGQLAEEVPEEIEELEESEEIEELEEAEGTRKKPGSCLDCAFPMRSSRTGAAAVIAGSQITALSPVVTVKLTPSLTSCYTG
jgi:hypothetical protein